MDPALYEGVSATIASYGHFLDDGEFDKWLDLFTADARFTIRGKLHEGRKGLEEFLANRGSGVRRHLYGLSTIAADGPDTCTATGDFVAFRPAEDGIKVISVGRYRDRLRRDPDRWRFTERTVIRTAGF